MRWIVRPWRQMFDFRGRATRREYWLLHLQVLALYAVAFGAAAALLGPDGAAGGRTGGSASPVGAVIGLFALPIILFCLIALVSAAVRRLHDHDKSGWFYLIAFAPFFGWIFFLIMMLTAGTTGENSYGADPRDEAAAEQDLAGVFT